MLNIYLKIAFNNYTHYTNNNFKKLLKDCDNCQELKAISSIYNKNNIIKIDLHNQKAEDKQHNNKKQKQKRKGEKTKNQQDMTLY